MKKLFLAVVLLTSLAGCGKADRIAASWTGYSETCVDGVTYIQFTSGAARKDDRNGKPVPCEV